MASSLTKIGNQIVARPLRARQSCRVEGLTGVSRLIRRVPVSCLESAMRPARRIS